MYSIFSAFGMACSFDLTIAMEYLSKNDNDENEVRQTQVSFISLFQLKLKMSLDIQLSKTPVCN